MYEQIKAQIIPLNTELTKSYLDSLNQESRGIIKENGEEVDMMQEKYNFEKELKSLEEKTDLKLKNIEDRTSVQFDRLSEKIDMNSDLIIAKMENLIKDQQINSNEESKKDRRWLIGIVISLVAIAVPVLMSTLKDFIQ